MAETIGGWWLASSVELEDGETVRYRGQIILRQSQTYGELFLTTRRLVWIRWRFAFPFVRKLLEVPLSDIESWSVERAPWWRGAGFVGSRRHMVRVRTTSRTFDLLPVYSGDDADDWAEALDEVMTEAGLASRGGRK